MGKPFVEGLGVKEVADMNTTLLVKFIFFLYGNDRWLLLHHVICAKNVADPKFLKLM